MHEHELDTLLTAAAFRQDCPDSIILADFHAHLLSAAQSQPIHTHTQQCQHCQSDLATLNTFITQEADTHTAWHNAIGYQWQRLRATGKILIKLLDDALTPPIPNPLLSPVKRGNNHPQNQQPLRHINLSAEQTGDTDIDAIIYPIDATTQTHQVTVRVQIPHRWPDLADVPVQLHAPGWQAEQITDEAGGAVFTAVPAHVIEQLSIIIGQQQ